MANLNIDWSDKRSVLQVIVIGEGVLLFGFAISSFVVAGTANAGFNVVLTALLNIAFVAGSIFIIRKSKTPIAMGFLMGVSGMMTILSLMTAIYWGQLSNCEKPHGNIRQYSCNQRDAYVSVCTFASLLFIVQLAFTSALVLWRNELIGEDSSYDEIAAGKSSDYPTASYDKTPSQYSNVASVDL